MMTENYNAGERISPPKKAYDKEYATQYRKEMEYLLSRGIKPTYVKRDGEYHIPTYKYTKTPELFIAAAEFYNQQRNEKTYNALSNVVQTAAGMSELIESLH